MERNRAMERERAMERQSDEREREIASARWREKERKRERERERERYGEIKRKKDEIARLMELKVEGGAASVVGVRHCDGVERGREG